MGQEIENWKALAAKLMKSQRSITERNDVTAYNAGPEAIIKLQRSIAEKDHATEEADRAYLFERAFLERCEVLREQNGMTKSELARRAFGSSKGATYRAYCRLLQVQKRAKPKRLNLEDAYRLALVWYPSFHAMCYDVMRLMEDKLQNNLPFI